MPDHLDRGFRLVPASTGSERVVRRGAPPDGSLVYVQAPYYMPGDPLARVVVLGADGRERFSETRRRDQLRTVAAGCAVAGTGAGECVTTRVVQWNGGELVASDVP